MVAGIRGLEWCQEPADWNGGGMGLEWCQEPADWNGARYPRVGMGGWNGVEWCQVPADWNGGGGMVPGTRGFPIGATTKPRWNGARNPRIYETEVEWFQEPADFQLELQRNRIGMGWNGARNPRIGMVRGIRGSLASRSLARGLEHDESELERLGTMIREECSWKRNSPASWHLEQLAPQTPQPRNPIRQQPNEGPWIRKATPTFLVIYITARLGVPLACPDFTYPGNPDANQYHRWPF